jgi:zinc transport system ATP-binding protein
MKALLEVKNLDIGYDGKAISEDISFVVQCGAYVCIVGENGAGKSTLLKTLTGLQKPLFGEVCLGVPRKEIGYLPQQNAVQGDFPASVREIVSSGALSRISWYRPFMNKAELQRIEWACEKTGITEIAKKCFRELSGGQQKRTLLARALVTSQKAIILDEPTAGLDPDATAEFYELLAKLNRDDGVTIIMVTHDLENTDKYATHVLELFTKRAGVSGTQDDDFVCYAFKEAEKS